MNKEQAFIQARNEANQREQSGIMFTDSNKRMAWIQRRAIQLVK